MYAKTFVYMRQVCGDGLRNIWKDALVPGEYACMRVCVYLCIYLYIEFFGKTL